MFVRIYSTPLTNRVLDLLCFLKNIHFYLLFSQRLFNNKLQSDSTKIDFAENQQFSSLISLSPLNATPHDFLQQIRVRSSDFYVLLLVTPSSLDFGFNHKNFCFFLTFVSFTQFNFFSPTSYLFKLAFIIKLLTHYTKGTIFYYVISTFCISTLFTPF